MGPGFNGASEVASVVSPRLGSRMSGDIIIVWWQRSAQGLARYEKPYYRSFHSNVRPARGILTEWPTAAIPVTNTNAGTHQYSGGPIVAGEVG